MTDRYPKQYRLRVRYRKSGRLKYLGHLEVLHTIERIVRRAELPYAVTQGFSPHMRTGFSSALPVGTCSDCEWFDLFMTDPVPVEDALARLAASSPTDLSPMEAGYIDQRSAALTAFLTRLEYRVELHCDPAFGLSRVRLSAAIDDVRSQHGIDYLRGKKSKHLDLDRTLLGYRLEEVSPSEFVLTLDTHADNEGSMRPELLLSAVDMLLAPRSDSDGEPIVSTGMQDLRVIKRYDVIRTDQSGESEDGSRVYPLPRLEANKRSICE